MDWTELKETLGSRIKQQKYLLLILVLGIFLMNLPSASESEIKTLEPEVPHAETLQESLSRILSQVSGTGKVEVLLTQAEGEESIYQLDEDISSGDIRQNTVLVTDSEREETGLIRRTDPPVYRGAIVLCQGADNPAVRLSVVQAVMSVTGLTSDRITVLKMK